MNYFKTEKLTENLIRIIDCIGVCCYLVIGSDRACLLDTGCGYGNIKKYVQTLTDKPIFVILTHGHYDHMGGASLFDEVYMNLDDLEVFKKHTDPSWRNYVSIQNDIVGKIPNEEHIPYANPLLIKGLKDGDCFNLGGEIVKMISVKGHTPGMMCPLLMKERTIIFGDACGVGVLLFDEYSSVVSEYKQSLLNLKKLENEYDIVYRNHGTFTSQKELLDYVIECCNLILSGKDDHQPVTIHGISLFSAKRTGENGRLDGKEGNIMYTEDKVK